MEYEIMPYTEADVDAMIEIWNEVVRDGAAFPQLDELNHKTGVEFFGRQDFAGVAKVNGEVAGLYILHPNNVGRCGHHANASYAVSSKMRGMKIGEGLVRHSLEKAKELGYRILIFNAVVKGNDRAIQLYTKLGFQRVGVIPGGYLLKNGVYQDIYVYYHVLSKLLNHCLERTLPYAFFPISSPQIHSSGRRHGFHAAKRRYAGRRTAGSLQHHRTGTHH